MNIFYILVVLLIVLDLAIISFLLDARRRVRHLESMSGKKDTSSIKSSEETKA